LWRGVEPAKKTKLCFESRKVLLLRMHQLCSYHTNCAAVLLSACHWHVYFLQEVPANAITPLAALQMLLCR
jgi:hypothetical protein